MAFEMRRKSLNDLTLFVEVVQRGGFRAAADQLGIGPGSVSDAIRRLEEDTDTQLLVRTTRQVALTAAGRELYEQCRPSLETIDRVMRSIHSGRDRISGVLKLSAPISAGPLFLNALLAEYLHLYTDMQVDVTYEDAKVDLVTAGVDAVIRSRSLLEMDTYAVPVGPKLDMAVVAAPSVLETGVPQTPTDLADRDAICFRAVGSQKMAPWNFEGEQGSYAVEPKPRAYVNDLATMVYLAEQGLGFAYLYEMSVKDSLTAGRLVSVLAGQASPLARYAINYVNRRHMPAPLSAFIELAKG